MKTRKKQAQPGQKPKKRGRIMDAAWRVTEQVVKIRSEEVVSEKDTGFRSLEQSACDRYCKDKVKGFDYHDYNDRHDYWWGRNDDENEVRQFFMKGAEA